MSAGIVIALRQEVHAARTEHGPLAAPWAAMPMPGPETPERGAVDRLLHSPAEGTELDRLAVASGPVGLARWLLWAAKAREHGLLYYQVRSDGGAILADLVPTVASSPNLMVADPPAVAGQRVQLSRFAMLRRVECGLVVESPLATMTAALSVDAAAAVAACAVPVAADDPLPFPRTMSAADGRTLVSALLAAGLLAVVGDDGQLEEDRDVALSQWGFPDLLLHARTRNGRINAPRGATFPFAAVRPAPPALPHPAAGPATIALERPDLDRLRAQDVPLARVMEDRCSRRDLGPLTAGPLGEFLFRTMRVLHAGPAPDGPTGYPTTSRPYPSAGGMYEFTTYLAIGTCQGIPAGLFRYDARLHALDPVAPAGPGVDALLRDGGKAARMDALPPTLVVLAADFRRLSWKYEGIAYALTLKNVGVLLQSMQLVATAMGLGSCPVGAGDSELFARTAGTVPTEESSVGELLLGSCLPSA